MAGWGGDVIPLAVIGGGQIGLRHIQVALASEKVRLVGVVEPNEARRAQLAQQGLPTVVAISDLPTETQAAIVATPTPNHFDASHEALDAGLSLIVEKPLTATPDEGRQLISAAQRRGLPLYCGHHRRCHPFSLAARKALLELGPLVGIQALWSLRKHDSYFDVPWRRAPGAGPLMTNLSHEIDLMRFFAGEITEVTALTSNATRGLVIEDTAALAFRFASGTLASVLISDAGASPWAFEAGSGENPDIAVSGEDYLRVTGTQGALAFPSLTHWNGGDHVSVDWRKAMTRFVLDPLHKVDPLFEQLERFASVLEGKTDDVLCTAEEGLAAAEWTLAVALSAKLRRATNRTDVPGNFQGV